MVVHLHRALGAEFLAACAAGVSHECSLCVAGPMPGPSLRVALRLSQKCLIDVVRLILFATCEAVLDRERLAHQPPVFARVLLVIIRQAPAQFGSGLPICHFVRRRLPCSLFQPFNRSQRISQRHDGAPPSERRDEPMSRPRQTNWTPDLHRGLIRSQQHATAKRKTAGKRDPAFLGQFLGGELF